MIANDVYPALDGLVLFCGIAHVENNVGRIEVDARCNFLSGVGISVPEDVIVFGCDADIGVNFCAPAIINFKLHLFNKSCTTRSAGFRPEGDKLIVQTIFITGCKYIWELKIWSVVVAYGFTHGAYVSYQINSSDRVTFCHRA